MNQPYIDCARRLAAQGVRAEDVVDVVCETAQGYVARLWEPLAAQAPAGERLRREILHAVQRRGRVRARRRRTRRVHRRNRARSARARARGEGPLRRRPGQSVSAALHRPRAHDAEGRARRRGTAAAYPRRQARAAVARRIWSASSSATRDSAVSTTLARSGCCDRLVEIAGRPARPCRIARLTLRRIRCPASPVTASHR